AILGDVTRLRHVLINLVNNAVKFTDKGEVSLHARLAQEPQGDGEALLEFSVHDTGIGIPAERTDALFQAFTQVDASTTRKYGGTGLGLAICKRLVELMGGEIHVRSELGQGSTFTFTIQAPITELPPAIEPLDARSLQGKRVLVVDDHPVNVRVLTRQLRQWGLLVASASSGATALDMLAGNEPPDLVVTDMHMPGMDGMELARHIRSEPWGAKLPLMLLSSGFLPGVSEGGVLFDARLLKPARQNQMFDAITRCLAGEKAAKAPTERADVHNGIRVLVVDDNSVNIKVASAMLARLGYEPVTAMDGREALEATAAADTAGRPFGAILMDLHMPTMDGLESTALIQRQFGERAPPIIALTADASIEDRDRCTAAGMDDYLTKPLQVGALTQALLRWAHHGRAGTVPAEATVAARMRAAALAPAVPATSAAPVKAEPLVDLARLEEFREFDPEMRVVRDALATMMEEAPARLEGIAAACERGDAAALTKEAHTLRGSAGNVGAPVLSALCAAIEKAAASGTVTPQTATDVARLPACWRATRAALQAWLESSASEVQPPAG
ncbi:MAG TPA: response regulator, partial [Ramlibacter sp.]|nr:response regulator [Ramlibacter sp.]